MKLDGICPCCGKTRKFEIKKIEFRVYDLCGCENNDECNYKWHEFIIDEKEIFRKFYPELEYKMRGCQSGQMERTQKA